ncbi:MAG: excinuclease ABC subunit UvrC [Gammaproteobacteria bacterium]|nr:excinuclease ABC subunit UvrC [Gammaproteobacteria bacterium]
MTAESSAPSFDYEAMLKSLPTKCGVYRMLDANGKVLYVGKARNLKNRVTSYFRAGGLASKTIALMSKTRDVQVTALNSEVEALILEQTFIKNERPPYNVILRDDKSYPFILFSHHKYPSISFHRGAKRHIGQYFGPYPSAKATRDTIQILQKLFRLRTCDDTFFNNRTRPCLQYQIGRCSGSCVLDVDTEAYQADLQLAEMFLRGKSEDVLNEFKRQMNSASENLEFERAAVLRDQITDLVRVQQAQYVETSTGSADVFGIATSGRYVCIQGIFIRDGRMLGHRTWYPRNEINQDDDEMLAAFLAQYYVGGIDRDLPREILTSVPIEDEDTLQRALTDLAQHRVVVSSHGITQRARWLKLIRENTELALSAYMDKRRNVFERYAELQEALGLDDVPQRMECFDVSHSQGEATVASCVVFDNEGPVSSDYRRFNIKTAVEGDDYGAMAEAINRHYTKLKSNAHNLPDILLIDGGLGQLHRVMEVLTELQIDSIIVLGISKGEGRRAINDTVWTTDDQALNLAPNSGALHLLQQLRDEAHRFAITGHRNRRQKQRRKSELDGIVGVGPKRKRELLTHFGSVASIKGASIEELGKVPGVSTTLAREIYGVFHDS